jgi:uncharacterized protein (TIGR03437 family)
MKKHLSHCFWLAAALLLISSVFAQTTKPININISGTSTDSPVLAALASGSGTINPFGNAVFTASSTQALDKNSNPTGPTQATITFAFNRLDSVTGAATVPNFTDTATFPVTITGGTGAFNGATGSGTFTVRLVSADANGAQLTLSGTGNIKVGQTTTAISVSNLSYRAAGNPVDTISATGTGTVSGTNVNMNATLTTNDGITAQGTAVFADPAGTDSLTVFFKISNLNTTTYTLPTTVIGGTGVFAGASGSLPLTLTNTSKSAFSLTGSGSVTLPAAGTTRPTITSVKTSGSDATFIAPNTWVEIQGNGLVPANTSGLVTWSTAPEFNANPPHMPIQLGTISATTNGKAAYIYLYCHACGVNQTDQINILTSLDATVAQMLVVVTNGSVSSVPFVVTMQAASPSFLRWDLQGHPVATHADGSLLGPTSLFQGLSTPARKQEPIVIYGDGFGLPTATLVEGSSSQSGVLPNPQPICTFGTTQVAATVVLVTPGLYGIGLTVPNSAVSGDNPVTCWYGGAGTPAGDVISVL